MNGSGVLLPNIRENTKEQENEWQIRAETMISLSNMLSLRCLWQILVDVQGRPLDMCDFSQKMKSRLEEKIWGFIMFKA